MISKNPNKMMGIDLLNELLLSGLGSEINHKNCTPFSTVISNARTRKRSAEVLEISSIYYMVYETPLRSYKLGYRTSGDELVIRAHVNEIGERIQA